jgi:hypothetical protein
MESDGASGIWFLAVVDGQFFLALPFSSASFDGSRRGNAERIGAEITRKNYAAASTREAREGI